MADAAAEPRATIPVFSGQPETFGQWCFVMRMHLRRLGLVRCIEADQHVPHPADDSRTYTEVCLYLREDAIGVVREVPEGRGFLAWTALSTRYQGRRFARESLLQAKLCALRWTREHTVNSFRLEFLGLRRDLVALGQASTIPDRVLCNILLAGMPQRFTTVVERYQDPEDVPADGADFYQRLTNIFEAAHQCEARQAQHDTHDSHAGFAAAASRPPVKVECNYCGRSGHVEAECRTKVRHAQERTGARVTKKAKSHQPQHSAFSATPSLAGMHSHFAIDTGATTHLSGNKNLFNNLDPIGVSNPIMVTVADGRNVQAQGRGHLARPHTSHNRFSAVPDSHSINNQLTHQLQQLSRKTRS